MKQFARCTNCRRWYNRAFTTTVEVYPGDQLCRMTIWCLRCIDEAELRSQPPQTAQWESSETQRAQCVSQESTVDEASHHRDFQHLVQEHLELMERAIQEDDAVIIPLVEDFMQRCRTHHQRLQPPELAQRLWGHLQYWETFLNALRQSL